MDFKNIVEMVTERKGAVAAAALGIAALGGLAWALSTGPLTPIEPGAGSTGSMDSGATVTMGSAATADLDAEKPAVEPAEQEDSAVEGAAAVGAQEGVPGEDKEGGTANGKPVQNQQSPKPHQGPAQPSPKPEAPKPSTQKPSHKHSWSAVYRSEPVYGQQWVSKWEDVYTRHVCWECSACGGQFSSNDAIDSHIWATYGDAKHPNGASAIDQSYTTVEKVDKGSYQTVQTGTTQVLDHYACSCGATK